MINRNKIIISMIRNILIKTNLNVKNIHLHFFEIVFPAFFFFEGDKPPYLRYCTKYDMDILKTCY